MHPRSRDRSAVYFSPADLVYAQVARPGPVRTVVHVYESIDGTAGVVGVASGVSPGAGCSATFSSPAPLNRALATSGDVTLA